MLESIRDASEILFRLLEGGQSIVAGRLAGAFRHINRTEIADELLKTMETAGSGVSGNQPVQP